MAKVTRVSQLNESKWIGGLWLFVRRKLQVALSPFEPSHCFPFSISQLYRNWEHSSGRPLKCQPMPSHCLAYAANASCAYLSSGQTQSWCNLSSLHNVTIRLNLFPVHNWAMLRGNEQQLFPHNSLLVYELLQGWCRGATVLLHYIFYETCTIHIIACGI